MRQPILRTLPIAIALAFGSSWAVAQTSGATSAGNTAQGAGKSSAQPDKGKLSHGDREFIEDAAKGGMFEVQSGQIAAQKATDPQVKEFANKLVQDHTKANNELKQIAEAKGVQIPDKDKWTDKHEINKLEKLSGDKFDREFAEHSVKDHEKDIKKFEKAANSVKDPELKAWAEKTLPTLREHLAMAQKLPEAGKQKNASNASSSAPNTRAAGAAGSKS
jgi:putative membrane protein